MGDRLGSVAGPRRANWPSPSIVAGAPASADAPETTPISDLPCTLAPSEPGWSTGLAYARRRGRGGELTEQVACTRPGGCRWARRSRRGGRCGRRAARTPPALSSSRRAVAAQAHRLMLPIQRPAAVGCESISSIGRQRLGQPRSDVPLSACPRRVGMSRQMRLTAWSATPSGADLRPVPRRPRSACVLFPERILDLRSEPSDWYARRPPACFRVSIGSVRVGMMLTPYCLLSRCQCQHSSRCQHRSLCRTLPSQLRSVLWSCYASVRGRGGNLQGEGVVVFVCLCSALRRCACLTAGQEATGPGFDPTLCQPRRPGSEQASPIGQCPRCARHSAEQAGDMGSRCGDAGAGRNGGWGGAQRGTRLTEWSVIYRVGVWPGRRARTSGTR